MIIRNTNGKLIEININDFVNDKEYYRKVILLMFNVSIDDD